MSYTTSTDVSNFLRQPNRAGMLSAMGAMPAAEMQALLPRRLTAAFLSAPKTLTETPAALFAGSTELANRRWLILRNESTDIRLRYGRLQADLQRDGEILEPGAVAMIQLDPTSPLTLYGCSEGRSITANIGEDVG